MAKQKKSRRKRQTGLAETSAMRNVQDAARSASTASVTVSQWLAYAIEFILLLLAVLSPWAFGGIGARIEFCFVCGVAVAIFLWAVRIILEMQLRWMRSPVLVCLCGVFLLAAWQITPLSPKSLKRLSPVTASLYENLLPDSPEVLHGGEEHVSISQPGSTISIYPYSTRAEMMNVLVVLLIFAVALNNLGPGSLQRLCIALLINGALLALFGLIQVFTVPARDLLYWRLPTNGSVFGPFVNRGHYAMYANLCIAAGVGLLSSRSLVPDESNLGMGSRPIAQWRWQVQNVFHDPSTLWICLCLALMIVSVPLSLSRGGTISMLFCFSILVFAVSALNSSLRRMGQILCVFLLSIALLTWIGWNEILESRLTLLWTGNALAESRLPLWSKMFGVTASFPIWGTGHGTFEYIEPLYGDVTQFTGGRHAHAHNEYLEALVEGGIVRLAISVTAIGFVFYSGLRAWRAYRGSSLHGLVVGAIMAITTLVIHSFGEFGIHLPSVAIVAVLLSAHLSRLGTENLISDGDSDAMPNLAVRTPAESSDTYMIRIGGAAPVIAAIVLVGLGLLLCRQYWYTARADRLRIAADRFTLATGAESLPEQLLCLGEASRFVPTDARMHLALAETQFEIFETVTKGIPESSQAEQQSAKQTYLDPALRHWLQARDCCPLLAMPHLWLSDNVSDFDKADSRESYLRRAKFLSPSDPIVWYACGLQELQHEDLDETWRSWNHSLKHSADHLTDILNQCMTRLSAQEAIEHVLPADPGILYKAATLLFPEPAEMELRRPFLEEALSVLRARSGDRKPEDLWIESLVLRSLGQHKESLVPPL